MFTDEYILPVKLSTDEISTDKVNRKTISRMRATYVRTIWFHFVPKQNEAILFVRNDVTLKLIQWNDRVNRRAEQNRNVSKSVIISFSFSTSKGKITPWKNLNYAIFHIEVFPFKFIKIDLILKKRCI